MNNTGFLIYGVSTQCADLLYSTHFSAHDPFVYFEIEKKKFVVVSSLELERAQKECKKGIVVIDRNKLLTGIKYKTSEALLSRIIEEFPCKEWVLHRDFPFELGCYLREVLKKGRISCISETNFVSFAGRRRTKTIYEIGQVKKALCLAERAMLRAETILKESKINNYSELIYRGEKLTSEFIKSNINFEIVKGGGYSQSIIVSSGKQTAIPHDVGTGIIKSDVPIIIDIFPRLEKTGYWGDITRTFVKGKTPDIVKKAYLAVKKARDYAKTKVKTGTIPDTLHKETALILKKHGFKTGKKNNTYFGFFHGLGHGVGVEIHELPQLALSVTTPLKEGDLFTIEPGVYYSEWGGVRLEDILYIDREGRSNCLTKYPDNLEID